MTSNNFLNSDLPNLYNWSQSSAIVYPKELILSSLRNYFSQDSTYHFSKDAWGFPNVHDMTDIDASAGLHDDVTTRVYIGEIFHQDSSFYPCLLVRHQGVNSVPISMNREKGSVQYAPKTYVDGYGNVYTVPMPESYIFAGAWEGTISIDVYSRGLRSRDDLAQLVANLFVDIEVLNLEKEGLFIKGVNIGAGSENEDRNDKMWHTSVTLSIRSEWRRNIPIGNIIDMINFSVEFGRLDESTPIAPNITIDTSITLLDMLDDL